MTCLPSACLHLTSLSNYAKAIFTRLKVDNFPVPKLILARVKRSANTFCLWVACCATLRKRGIKASYFSILGHHLSSQASKRGTKKCVNSWQNSQKWSKRAKIRCFLCKKGYWLEKSTPPPAVAVVTNMSYGGIWIGGEIFTTFFFSSNISWSGKRIVSISHGWAGSDLVCLRDWLLASHFKN